MFSSLLSAVAVAFRFRLPKACPKALKTNCVVFGGKLQVGLRASLAFAPLLLTVRSNINLHLNLVILIAPYAFAEF